MQWAKLCAIFISCVQRGTLHAKSSSIRDVISVNVCLKEVCLLLQVARNKFFNRDATVALSYGPSLTCVRARKLLAITVFSRHKTKFNGFHCHERGTIKSQRTAHRSNIVLVQLYVVVHTV